MRYLPISYDTKDKNLLILGGGLLALSKIKEMLKTEFRIYVISESFVDEIYKLQEQNPTQLYLKEVVIDENFVFFAYDFLLIATTNFELNNAIETRAIKTGILYERCDVVSSSNIMLNNVIEQEDIIVGISKEKLNPTISEIVKDDIKNLVKEYNPDKIKILNQIRAELVRKNSPDVDETIKKLFNEEKISAESYLNELKEKDITENAQEDITEIINDTEVENIDSDDLIINTIENFENKEKEPYQISENINTDAEKTNLTPEDISLKNEDLTEDKIEMPDMDFEIRHNLDKSSEIIVDETKDTSKEEINSLNDMDQNPMAAFHRPSSDSNSYDDRITKEKNQDEKLNHDESFQNKLKSGWNKFSKSGIFKKDKK